MTMFQQIFNAALTIEASAPGRVNLLGEHTDYNDGVCAAHELEELVSLTTADPTLPGFASYVFGCLQVVEQVGYSIPPLNIYVNSSVPTGSGLSSSAALEVSLL